MDLTAKQKRLIGVLEGIPLAARNVPEAAAYLKLQKAGIANLQKMIQDALPPLVQVMRPDGAVVNEAAATT